MTTTTHPLCEGVTVTIDWDKVPPSVLEIGACAAPEDVDAPVKWFNRPAPTFTSLPWARERVAHAHGARIRFHPGNRCPSISRNQDWSTAPDDFYDIHPDDEPYFDERGFPKEASK